MTAPEREALVKALREGADFYARERPRAIPCKTDSEIGPNECEAIAKRMDHAADLIEALSASPAVTVTEEMVERAAEVIAGDTAPVSFCRHTARIALERALKSTTPQTGSQE